MGEEDISFYKGGYSSLNPEYGNFTGYRFPEGTGVLSSTTSPMVPNQVGEVVSRIKEGVKNVEIGTISPDTFETIPKQHFKEIRALMKLSGVKPSLHAPIQEMDPSGFDQRNNKFQDEGFREQVEDRLFNAVEKAHELSHDEPIPVVMHATGTFVPQEFKPKEGSKPGDKDRFQEVSVPLVDVESGQIVNLAKEDRKYYLDTKDEDFEKGGSLMTIDKQLRIQNETAWDEKVSTVLTKKKFADDMLNQVVQDASKNPALLEATEKLAKGNDEESIKEYQKALAPVRLEVDKAQTFLADARLSFSGVFNNVYEYGTPDQKKDLDKLRKEWQDDSKKLQEKFKKEGYNEIQATLEESRKLDQYLLEMNQIATGMDANTKKPRDAPQKFVKIEDFAIDKAAKTFGNLGWKSYDKFKDNAPIIAMENVYPGTLFHRADKIKELLEKSRKEFIEQAKSKGMKEKEARKKAEKVLGFTWDVGHLNMIKKEGFTDEDVVSETMKVAKDIKHLHITDNFGYADTHLAPGMGNVPFKKVLEKLEKEGRLNDMKVVIEAGSLVNPQNQFKMSPFTETMNAFGSSFYGGSSEPAYFSHGSGSYGSYFGFPLAQMPEKHFSIYGSSFSSLPEELGGQIPGGGSRFSGTPNA